MGLKIDHSPEIAPVELAFNKPVVQQKSCADFSIGWNTDYTIALMGVVIIVLAVYLFASKKK